MRTLPENICTHPDGLLVRVMRNKVLFQAFVPASHPAGLERAIVLRDRFLANAGAKNRPKSRRPHAWSRSNTGITGISETVKFNGVRAYPCFNVSWGEAGKQRTKRFYFGYGIGREIALKSAINHRQKMTEVVYA